MSSDTPLQTIESLKQDLTQRDVEIRALRLANEKMKVELTYLRRMRYGRSSERMDAAQSQLELLSAALAPVVALSASVDDTSGAANGSNVVTMIVFHINSYKIWLPIQR